MNNTTARRVRLAGIALAPIFVLVTPALASAATDPGAQSGQYSSSSSSTDAQGTTRTTTMTYQSPEGPVYQRSTQRNTPQGSSMHMVRSSDGRQEVIDSRNDANGMNRTDTTSCTGSDGQASYRRTVTQANSNGSGENTVSSGNANCAAIPAASDSSAAPGNQAKSQPAAGSSAVGTANAPLVIVNAPDMPGK